MRPAAAHARIELNPDEVARSPARQRVTTVDYPGGRVAIRHKRRDLPYRTFDKQSFAILPNSSL